ncbi:hypothetical protein ELI00_15525 [Rhizobium ruizarguesonis]|uniref:hypothetical protein n=1 Tax=Rhizobium ruizarguesonis TaxID=2081791 RepID=UPI00102F33BE|nr:hypothetical protein [Rhizobium ruizarguesonis]TAX77537.1 hypothetical protein ELI00_15525 [Rhizobium ruizarguesonis]
MVFGRPGEGAVNVTGRQAAAEVGLSWRTVREALEKPAVKAYFLQMYDTLRNAEKPASVRRMVDIRDDDNLKTTAAGRTVQLKAAQALAYEPTGHQVHVNTLINNTLNVTPGYVIRIGGSKGRSPPTIDANPIDDEIASTIR